MWYDYLIVDKCQQRMTETLRATVSNFYAKASVDIKKKE